MSEEKSTRSGPVIVEDLFLTDTFLIKGRLTNKFRRLTTMLEDMDGSFLAVEDATMVALRGNEVVRTPRVMINPKEIIMAHELLELAGDSAWRHLAQPNKTVRIRAFYNGSVHLELTGKIEPGSYEFSHGGGRQYFIIQNPVVRGLNITGNNELSVLHGLDYAIIHKNRLAYVYDFS